MAPERAMTNDEMNIVNNDERPDNVILLLPVSDTLSSETF